MKKEKPILFSTDMVKAILAGNKTVTRRVIKPQPNIVDHWPDGKIALLKFNDDFIKWPWKPGMILWVRETWARVTDCIDHTDHYFYRADGEAGDLKWKPSIFMPREACRLLLQVLEVQAERLQDITLDEALKEGIRVDGGTAAEIIRAARERWIELWDSINAARGYPWAANPWIWRIEFKIRGTE